MISQGNIMRLVCLGIIGAAIIHIAILLLVPVYSDTNAWSRIEDTTEPYRFHRLDNNKSPIGEHDPLFVEATCRFDLSDGPTHITAQGVVPYWSLSVYAPNGDNLYSINDSVSNERKLDLIIADPLGMANLKAGSFGNAPTSLTVEQNIGEGAVIVRVFTPDTSWQTQVQRFFDSMKCLSLDDSAG